MKVGLAIWPRNQAEWYELGLSSIADTSIASIDARANFEPVDLLIVDGDNPGPSFHAYLKHPDIRSRTLPLVVMGQPTSAGLYNVDWDPAHTVFVAKPCQIEDVIATVQKKLDSLQNHPSDSTPTTTVAQDDATETRKPLGYLSTLRLPDLIQMLCLSSWTGKIEILNLTTNETGLIHLNVGVMIHAAQGKIEAESAVYRMLAWGRCEFHFVEEHPPVLQTIKTHWQEIMLEGARVIDEGRLSGLGL